MGSQKVLPGRIEVKTAIGRPGAPKRGCGPEPSNDLCGELPFGPILGDHWFLRFAECAVIELRPICAWQQGAAWRASPKPHDYQRNPYYAHIPLAPQRSGQQRGTASMSGVSHAPRSMNGLAHLNARSCSRNPKLPVHRPARPWPQSAPRAVNMCDCTSYGV